MGFAAAQLSAAILLLLVRPGRAQTDVSSTGEVVTCPATWQRLGSTKYTYYLHSIPMPFLEARAYCAGIGAALAMPVAAAQNDLVWAAGSDHGLDYLWNNCHRVDGTWGCRVEGVDMWPPFNNPADDQPNMAANCLGVGGADGKWRHTPCDWEARPLCERHSPLNALTVRRCMAIGPDGRPDTRAGQCVHNPAL